MQNVRTCVILVPGWQAHNGMVKAFIDVLHKSFVKIHGYAGQLVENTEWDAGNFLHTR